MSGDRHGDGAVGSVRGGRRYRPRESRNFRQGLGDHHQDQGEAGVETPGQRQHIKVDTNNGVVWMSGTANSQEEVNQAVTIARNTEGVKMVKSDLKVQKDR
jgi:hypothetical protein